MTDPTRDLTLQSAIEGVSAAFASLGRVFLCIDDNSRVLHAFSLVDRLTGRGASDDARGKPSAELNKVDLVNEAALLDLVEMEIRELLSEYNFEGERATILRGSALKAHKGEASALGSIDELLVAVESR